MKIVNGFEVPEDVDEPGSVTPWKNTKLKRKISCLSDTIETVAKGHFPNLRVGDATDNFSIENDGSFRLNGEAGQWKTMTTEGSATKQGSQDKPDFDYTNIGLLFPQNDPTEKIYIVGALQDDYMEGSNPTVVVYYIQNTIEVPTWKVDFRLNRPGVNVGSWVTLVTNTVKYSYTSGSMMQIALFPEIDGSIFLTGDEFDATLYRDDNVVTGDVLFKRISVYYQTDALGSRDKFAKDGD